MISVCIASYNGEKFIRQQLDSILMQLASEDEVIVSDDGSTDQTVQIIDAIDDERITVKTGHARKGVTHNFENALISARGDIIFLCDQDDVWLPTKVATCIAQLDCNDLVVSNCIVVDGDCNVLHTSYFDLAKSGPGFLKNFYRSTYLGCCLAFKRDVLNKVLPIPPSLLLFHDWWFGFIAECCLRVKFIDAPCMYYRRHDKTTSNTLAKSSLPVVNRITYRLQLLVLGLARVVRIKFAK